VKCGKLVNKNISRGCSGREESLGAEAVNHRRATEPRRSVSKQVNIINVIKRGITNGLFSNDSTLRFALL